MLSCTDDVAFLMKMHIFHQKKVFYCAAVRNRPIFGLWKIGHDENTMYGHVSDYTKPKANCNDAFYDSQYTNCHETSRKSPR